jgi:small subunit ribosomal protein S20
MATREGVCYYRRVRRHPPGCRGQHIFSRRGRETTQVANIKSQKKRILTNAKAQARNKAVRSAIKTAVKRVHEAVAAGDKAVATESLNAASRALDKAASKGVIHKNQAANRKAGIANSVKAMEG